MPSSSSQPEASGLTRYVADFVCGTSLKDLPAEGKL